MTLVVSYRSFCEPLSRFDQRPNSPSQNCYKASFPKRLQKPIRRSVSFLRWQDTSPLDFFTHIWKSESYRRNFSLRPSGSKKDNSSTPKSEDRFVQDPDDNECIDMFEDPLINSNVSPASIIVSQQKAPEPDQTKTFVSLVTAVLTGGILFSALVLVFVTDIGLKLSIVKVLRKLIKSAVARQMLMIIGTMIFVRSGLTPVVKTAREFLKVKTAWESSVEYYLLKELYSPLELLLGVAALAALAESVLPTLISVPRKFVGDVVHKILSLVFVCAAARVVHNMKGRIFRESKWKMEIEGKTTEQHRLDAFDKLLTITVLIVAFIIGLQSIGLDVNSVLAIGGVGGLAIGLAGREIFENLFSGLLIMGSRPFDVGDEITCLPTVGKEVTGLVVDIGWYRTLVRNWEREVYVIPNSLFSRSVVLNVTRRGKEWRFFEHLFIRLEDLEKVETVIADMRRIMRQDSRIIQKLHKRAFLNEINREYLDIYISFYLESPNRDAFMAARQQLYLAFTDCVLRNGAEISQKKMIIEYKHTEQTEELPLQLETVPAMVEDRGIHSNHDNVDDLRTFGTRTSSSRVELPRGVKKLSSTSVDLNSDDG